MGLVAGILLIYGIQILWLPINGVITLPPSIGQLVTVLIVLVVINAVNFIDGMDGLAAGIVAISGIAFFAFAYLLAVDYGFSRAGAPSLTTAVLVGLCIGFLPHNAHPARIFMGDSGSMLLGLLLASAAITLTGQVDPNAISAESRGPTLLPLLLPFAVLAIPLIDLFSAIIRRLRAGQSPFSSDKEHMHHRILRAGNTHLRTTLIMYLWTATIAFPVVVSAFEPLWVAAEPTVPRTNTPNTFISRQDFSSKSYMNGGAYFGDFAELNFSSRATFSTGSGTTKINLLSGDFLFHFEGSYHSNYDQGIIWWINKIQPGLKIKSITTVTESEWEEMTDEEKATIANYIIVVADNMTQTRR